MSESNFFCQVRLAAKRHINNRQIELLLDRLDRAEQEVRQSAEDYHRRDPLEYYEQSLKGLDDRDPMWTGDTVLLNSLYRRMAAHHECAIIADCLAILLIDLGENIIYPDYGIDYK